MAKTFISYSRKDITFAKRLTAELQKCELDFWIDWEGIPPTVDWWKEIEKGIEEADIFLFLISPDSANSKVCGQEIEVAVKNGKRIIPIVVRDIDWQDTPKHLGHLNYIFIRESDDFNTAVEKLIAAIQTDYEWAATHRRLQVKALEWERNGKDNGFLLRGRDLQDAEFDLATNTSKEPHPTDLQREYVFESRKVSDRQRRTLTIVSLVGVIALAVLAVLAFRQAQIANERAEIALARQLAAQSQYIVSNRNARQLTALLLAVQSINISPSVEAAQALANNTSLAARPIGQISHDDRVTAIAISPDNKYVVSGSRDGSVLVWEAGTGEKIASATNNTYVRSVAFSPDSKYAASGSDDGSIWILNVVTNEETNLQNEGATTSIAFSPDGKYIAAGGESVQVWNVLDGKKVIDLNYYAAPVAFSSDGKYLLAGGGNTIVWETTTWKEVKNLPISGLAFSSDGKYAVTDSGAVWNIDTEQEVSRITNESQVISVAISPDGRYAALANWDGIVYLWEAATGNALHSLVHDSTMEKINFSQDGNYIVTGSDDYTARVWEVATGREISRMTHDNYVYAVAFSPDGKYAASGSGQYDLSVGKDNSARVWETGTDQKPVILAHDSPITSVALSPDGKYVVAGSYYSIRVWKSATGEEIQQLYEDYANSIVFSSDGKYMMARYTDGYVTAVWKTDTWEELTSPQSMDELHPSLDPSVISSSEDIISFAVSQNGKYVASGREDGIVHVWDIAKSSEIAKMKHEAGVYSLAFSPDEKYIVSGSYDNTSRVWEIATQKEVSRLTQDDVVNSVAFSADSKYVVSGSGDNTAIVWEASTGMAISGRTHDNYIFAVTFSPDGKYVISGGEDSTVYIWEWQISDLVANACKNLPRNLTRAEWTRYIGDDREYEITCPNLPPANSP